MSNIANGVQPIGGISTGYRRLTVFAWLICSLAAVFYLYEYMLRVAPSVMTPQVMGAYHLTARGFGNLSAIYYYIYAPMQILVGMLMDRYGPRRLLTVAIVSCSVGSYMFAATTYLPVAEVGRFLVGFGSAFAFVGVLKLATIWLPHNRFAMVSGFAMACGMLGGIIGDYSLGALVGMDGWRLTLFWAACGGLILALLVFVFVRDENDEAHFIRCVEPVLTFKDICIGLWQIMKTPQIWINGLIGCLLYLPVSGFAESWQIPYLKQTLGFSHDQAATAAAMIFLGWAVGGPITGWISDTIRQRRLPITVGAVVSAIILSYLLYVPNISLKTHYVMLFIYGFFSSVQAIAFPIASEITSTRLAATAIAFTNMLIMTAGVSILVVGSALEYAWTGTIINGVHEYSAHAYQLAFMIFPIGLVAAVFLTFYLRETFCKQVKRYR